MFCGFFDFFTDFRDLRIFSEALRAVFSYWYTQGSDIHIYCFCKRMVNIWTRLPSKWEHTQNVEHFLPTDSKVLSGLFINWNMKIPILVVQFEHIGSFPCNLCHLSCIIHGKRNVSYELIEVSSIPYYTWF